MGDDAPAARCDDIALLLVPFGAYLLAEVAHASGVLAVVTAGLIVAFAGSRITTAASRHQTGSAWSLGSALLNGALFVLVGLQVQRVAHELVAAEALRLAGIAVAVWAGLLVTRFLFQVISVWTVRALDRRPAQRLRRMSHRARVVSTFAGFRGAISLAIALSVPATTPTGAPFPGRDSIVVVTGGVIVLTLLVQGPLLGPVVRWARLPEDAADVELQRSEHAIALAALEAVDTLAAAHGVSDEARDRLVQDYRSHVAAADVPLAVVATNPELGGVLTERRSDDDTRLRLAVMDHKRAVLWQLRRQGRVDDAVARRLETRLDIEELRLTGVNLAD